jgi:alpha-beta hydrolase superfamily lysophospholipase
MKIARRDQVIGFKYLLRTRFAKNIVAEFLPPAKKSNKVIILCQGMPSVPEKEELVRFLSNKGFWVIFPRYRGTWESNGSFLEKSPHQDILDIIAELPKGITNLWDGKKYKIAPKQIYLLGSSFGGPAAILASRNKKVNKAVVLSPVTDWQSQEKTEDLDQLEKFTRLAFDQAFRYSLKDWQKLKTGKFYNPMAEIDNINAGKILIIHAKDDKTVDYRTSQKFSRLTNAKLILLPKGGHLSISNLVKPSFYKYFREFVKMKVS